MVKRHARISASDTADDDLLTQVLIPAAVDTVQRDTRWQVEPLEYSIELYANATGIALPSGPFVSATLSKIAIGGQLTVVQNAGIVHDEGMPGSLSWPTVSGDHTGLRLAVRVAPLTPAPRIKLLVMTLVAHWYEHREAATADGSFSETPLGYQHAVKAMDPMTDAFRVAGAINIDSPCDAKGLHDAQW